MAASGGGAAGLRAGLAGAGGAVPGAAALAKAADHLGNGAGAPTEAIVLRARGCLARQKFTAARALLEETIAADEQALWPRVILSHVLLQEGKDWPAAERALLGVLALDPAQGEAQRNLALLRQRHGDVLSAARA